MTSSILLFLFISVIVTGTVWMVHSNKMTDQERDEMFDDDEMWP